MTDIYALELPKPNSFYEVLGWILVTWNHVEIIYHQVFREFLPLDPHVSHEFVLLSGNRSIGSVLVAATEIYARSYPEKDHLLTFNRGVNILRENRNILIHSLPDTDTGVYQGILKYQLEGEMMRFAETMDELDQLHKSLNDHFGYGVFISGALKHADRDAKFASLQKPSPPRKLNPSRPASTQ